MTTGISLSRSTALAFDFAIKLMAGLLNVKPDYDSEEVPVLDVRFSDQYFTTKVMEHLRLHFENYHLSRLEIGNSEIDPDSHWPESERRQVTLFASPLTGGRDVMISNFCVYRDYVDGERAEGWTRWAVKDVIVHIGDQTFKLCTHDLVHMNEKERLWGMVPQTA